MLFVTHYSFDLRFNDVDVAFVLGSFCLGLGLGLGGWYLVNNTVFNLPARSTQPGHPTPGIRRRLCIHSEVLCAALSRRGLNPFVSRHIPATSAKWLAFLTVLNYHSASAFNPQCQYGSNPGKGGLISTHNSQLCFLPWLTRETFASTHNHLHGYKIR